MRYTIFFLCLVAQAQLIDTLKPETLREFEAYQTAVDRESHERLTGHRPFLWIDEHLDSKKKAEVGEIVTAPLSGANGRAVTDGLIHDWVGAAYIPGARVETVRRFLLDTEKHAGTYPEVKMSRVLARGANTSTTLLRIVKKKVVTAVLDVEYQNSWQQPDPDRWVMRARSHRVVELDDDRPLPPDTGHGFLWRMNSQWSLRQDPNGVWIELRSVSLSRDTPKAVGWMVKPLIRNFPAEAILSTIKATRRAVETTTSTL